MHTRIIGVDERGQRVGESHPGAELTDREVDLMRTMHEVERMSYSRLAGVFECSKSTVAKICKYQRRASRAVRTKVVVLNS